MAEYRVSDIYQGGYSSFKPDYGDMFTGYRASFSDLGMTTNPADAAVLQDFARKANLGVKHIEVEELMPKTFDAMPKQYFKEINRLSKLSGVDVSAHGPVIEPSGVTQQGFTEASREEAERQIKDALIRSHDLKPDKPIIVNFHTSNYFPSPEISKRKVEGKEVEEVEKMYVMNQETGQLNAVKKEEKFYPGERGKEVHDVEKELKILNDSEWLNRITSLAEYKKHADEVMGTAMVDLAPLLEKKISVEELQKLKLSPEQAAAYEKLQRSGIFLDNVSASFMGLYDKAYKYSDDVGKKALKEISNKWVKDSKLLEKEARENPLRANILKSNLLNHAIQGIQIIENHAPQTTVPLDNFMVERSATSFGNAAFDAYKKFGSTAPILTIENPPANQQFSRGKDVRKMVELSREKFVEKAVAEGKLSKSQAKSQAEKMIGACWDVSHINMLRKFGFSEKDIVKETADVKPVVKHVHLADNFGFEHTELPMGMGNVPLKKMMEKLGKKGEEAKKILEAGDWWTQHVPKGAAPPLTPFLEGIGSPIYSMKMQPYWNQAIGFKQDYFAGYGEMLPPVHFETFGAGFSNLPAEIGGRAGGSRVTGRPME